MFIIVLSITNFFFDECIILRNNPEFYIFNSILDIIVSIYIATFLYRENWKKNIILIIFLLPVPSIAYLIFGTVGAATATLTAAIILRHIQHRLDEYNKKVDNLQSSIKKLEEKLDEQD